MRITKVGRTAMISGTALAMTLGVAPAGPAAAAPAIPGAPETGITGHQHPSYDDHFTFTRRHETYRNRDRIGEFNAHVDLDRERSRRYPMQWSFQITSDRLRDMATGRAVCSTRGDHDHDGRDDREVLEVGDVWRSYVRSHRTRRQYELSGECKFRVRDGGRRGEARVSFEFRYEINPRMRGSDSHDASSAFETEFDYDR